VILSAYEYKPPHKPLWSQAEPTLIFSPHPLQPDPTAEMTGKYGLFGELQMPVFSYRDRLDRVQQQTKLALKGNPG